MVGYRGIMPFYDWVFISLACLFARTSAMLLNRIIDIEIDRKTHGQEKDHLQQEK